MFSAASKTDNVSSAANYIEDVFSTYLYTGNSSTQTITNNIDLSGKGGYLLIQIFCDLMRLHRIPVSQASVILCQQNLLYPFIDIIPA